MPSPEGMTRLARARHLAGAMLAFLDAALVFDPATRRADLALGADGDLVMDRTPLTPMLVSLGTDRRARPDDELPTGITELNAPSSFVERRGWAGDALDARGRLIGSRLWLLDRAKETEITRRLCEEWAKEALGWAEEELERAAEVTAEWARRSVLKLTCFVDGTRVAIRLRAG